MQSLLYLLLTLAILVVIHEFGHFWVARRCGVKVLKFSVGFGKPLWRKFGADGTEYILAMIPLGGYVKMLDEREGEVKPEELSQAFNRKSLRARVAIVAAGPIANLMFAVFAYWFIFIIGVPGIRPIINYVIPDSPAAYARIVAGNEIKAVNGHETPTWSSVARRLAKASETKEEVELTIGSGDIHVDHRFLLPEIDLASSVSILQQIGFVPLRIELKPIIASVEEGGAAEKSGLQTGDLVLSVDEQVVSSWMQFVKIVQSSPDKQLIVVVERDLELETLLITPVSNDSNLGIIGVRVDSSKTTIPNELLAEERYGFGAAVGKAFYETWSFSTSTLKSLAGMVMGDVSSKNIGGPITIAQYASASADRGLVSFVSFLAMISISLGLLNLLPIPVLDGGHLALYLVEWLRGSPLSEAAQIQLQSIGIFLLLMLMFLAFFNDLTRLFG